MKVCSKCGMKFSECNRSFKLEGNEILHKCKDGTLSPCKEVVEKVAPKAAKKTFTAKVKDLVKGKNG